MSDDDDGLEGRRGRKRKPFPKPAAETRGAAKRKAPADRDAPTARAKPTEKAGSRAKAGVTAKSGAPAKKPSAKPGATARPGATAKPGAPAKPVRPKGTGAPARASAPARPPTRSADRPPAPAPTTSSTPTAAAAPPAPATRARASSRAPARTTLVVPPRPTATRAPESDATDGSRPLRRAPQRPVAAPVTRSSPGTLASPPRSPRPGSRRSVGPDVRVPPVPSLSSAETRTPRPGPARPPTVRLEHGELPEREPIAAAPSTRAAPRPGARAPSIAPPPQAVRSPAVQPSPSTAEAASTPSTLDDDAPAPPAIAVPDAALYEVEETIDRFLGDSNTDDRDARRRASEAFAQVAAQLGGANEPSGSDTVLDGARELLRPGYYVRQWGRLGLRNRSEEVDDFGLDRAYEARFRPLFEGLHRRWFRTSVHGLENVPAEGRCLLVANHGGALPWDGLMLRTAFRLEHPAHRELRWLAEDFVSHAPFLGAFVQRVGAVRACPENAERLLAQEKLVAVFPEGEKGVGKPFRERYELQRFGRGGYIKLALRTKTPIVPTAVIGSEEAHPLLFRTAALARLAGLPFLPVTPTFPWLGPLGLVPLPSRWVILCGEPIHLDDARGGPADPDDPIVVARLNDRVRTAVQDLVRRALGLRERPF